jgi:hypothetical protein
MARSAALALPNHERVVLMIDVPHFEHAIFDPAAGVEGSTRPFVIIMVRSAKRQRSCRDVRSTADAGHHVGILDMWREARGAVLRREYEDAIARMRDADASAKTRIPK